MKRIMTGVAAATLLAGCSGTETLEAPPPVAEKMVEKPMALGFDVANLDTNVRPQDDFYRYANGGWLERTEIPEDKSNYGSFTELHDLSRERLRAIIEEAAVATSEAGSDMQKVGDFYRSFMDTTAIEARGIEPVRPYFDAIDGIADKEALLTRFAGARRVGGASPFVFWVNQDAKQSTRYILYFSQSGLGLPDRDYYFKTNDKFVAHREAYQRHIATMLDMAGFDDAEARAQRIMALETRLAEHHWERVRNRDRNATYNRLSLEDAANLTPGIDWERFLADAGIEGQGEFIVRQPDYFTAAATLIADEPLDVWKDYLRFHRLSNMAPYLSQAFVDEDFDFYSRTLRGIEQNRPRWKRGVSAVEGALGEVVGRLYVERHFKPEAKARMDGLVENLREAFRIAIDDLEWMSDETKVQAQAKLAKFTPKIGYPDKWKDYSRLEVSPASLVDNVTSSWNVEYERMIGKLGKPIDRGEWFMSPQTVNAYYNPTMNEIVFPAAILQPPFFNMEADDAVNYGAIVAVIGHEFSHGFDDQGRKSDGDGNLRDWWTEQDAAEFAARANGLVEQYDAFSPVEGMNVNGKLTLGENIGDLAGLTMAYKAYRLSLGGEEPPVIDGFTGEQRFFMGWGQVWRRLYRDDELRNRLLTDSHSPSMYRVNGILSNMPQFQEAYGVDVGDEMYRAPDDVVHIW